MGAIAVIIVLLLAFAGPPFVRVWGCVGAFTSGERTEARVISIHDNGVSVRIETDDIGRMRTCFVPSGDLGRSELAAGDPIAVVVHAEVPERCTTQTTLDASEALLTAMSAVFVVLLLGLCLYGIRVQRNMSARPS